ncbi:HlyD family type I secretion periplasmic adaptor subunit [Candidatus Fukatsuia symbiotica]|uniref:Membrane fusion protein (MFP) family protein n=1 Tax=Candidatus Fukatsuia symbiotica TaxID=1878942 RepID=A0A2U8I8F7_9GAMM|nr:HlyD family type I secretion periplasmic adaptor subunit [Candidatus Fukatsuia symbiotica]AWK14335.1 HlyD family type I secretion periplasmic adaptor subunit [Candidatus Fukatsuia symbiotica]MEA9444596.1 HlyD family type I secretion periplasmic adaptor subunit [Candidatus Fukatsuia symbiotica]
MKFISQWIAKWRDKQQQAARTRDEYDFLPAYLDIVERPAAPWARRTAWAIALFLLLVLFWSIVGKLDIHATALGRVIVADHSKVVQPLEQGVVVAINVRDGERVHEGQVLIELNPVGIDAEVRNIKQQLMHRRLERARLTALLTDDPLANFTPPADSEPHLIETRLALLRRELDEMNAELKRQDVELAVNQANYQAVEQKIGSQQRLLKNIERRLQAHRTLAKTQAIAEVELLKEEREYLNAKAELSALDGQQSILLSQQQSYIQGKQRFLAEKKRDYRERLNKASEVISQLTQEQIKIVERQNLQTLKAPVDGVVQQLEVHTLGGVVTPAQQLMVVVPENNELELDAMLLNKDVGFVLPGQPVEVKVDSFPYTRYGTLAGEVKHVSRDAVDDPKQGLVFPVRVRLLTDTLVVDGKPVRLSAGMSVSAEIKTGRRRVIDYLLSPLQQYQSEALRER